MLKLVIPAGKRVSSAMDGKLKSIHGTWNPAQICPEQICRSLEAAFNEILQNRMYAMPVLNPALSVQALGFLRYQQDWLGVLITPWFMNVLLLPEADSTWQTQAPGSNFSRTFPYGVFEFTVANEAQLGVYAVC